MGGAAWALVQEWAERIQAGSTAGLAPPQPAETQARSGGGCWMLGKRRGWEGAPRGWAGGAEGSEGGLPRHIRPPQLPAEAPGEAGAAGCPASGARAGGRRRGGAAGAGGGLRLRLWASFRGPWGSSSRLRLRSVELRLREIFSDRQRLQSNKLLGPSSLPLITNMRAAPGRGTLALPDKNPLAKGIEFEGQRRREQRAPSMWPQRAKV